MGEKLMNKRKIWIIGIGLLTLLLIFLSFCACSLFKGGKQYYVGVSVPLSGDKKSRGELIVNALNLYAEEFNAKGGIDGVPVELVIKDDANDPAKSKENAREFADDKRILAVIGYYDDAVGMSALKVHDQAGLTIYSPSIGNREFTSQSKWSFRGSFSYDAQGESIAAYLSEVQKSKNILVFNTNDSYGTTLLKSLIDKTAKLGIAAKFITYDEKANMPDNFVATQITEADRAADTVVLLAHVDKGLMVARQVRALGIKAPIFVSDRMQGDKLAESNLSDVYLASPYSFALATLEVSKFEKRYLKEYGLAPSTYALFACDGLSLIAQAIKDKGADRQKIRDYLEAINSEATAKTAVAGKLMFSKHRSVKRDLVMQMLDQGSFKPTFEQLVVVTSQRVLDDLPNRVAKGEVVVVDNIPYYKVSVVYVGVDYYRVNQINTRDLKFDMELFLWFKWKGDMDIQNIIFLNEIPGRVLRNDLRSDTSKEIKWASYRVKGEFLNAYDLRLFPFDTQEMSLKLVHLNKNAHKVQLVIDKDGLSNKHLTEIYPQEWMYLERDDYAGTFNYESTFGNPSYKKGQKQPDYSIYQANVKARRDIFPYLVTLFLPLVILVAISLLVLLIPNSQFVPRNNLMMSSLLGLLLYHMSQAKSLPQVGYLVGADRYFIAAYLLLFILITAMNLINQLVAKKQEALAHLWEKRFVIIFILLVLLIYGSLTGYYISIY